MSSQDDKQNIEFFPPNDPFTSNDDSKNNVDANVDLESQTGDSSGLLNENSSKSEASSFGNFIQTVKSCPCKHPISSFFHIFFKICAMLAYQFLYWFTKNFVLTFVIVVILLAFDFWAVKNVTGRLLVGYRWWNEVQEDGTSIWRFEAKKDRSNVDMIDSFVFWGGLYLNPVIWILFAVISVASLQLEWLLVIAFALVLGLSNVYGYTKCSRNTQKQVVDFIARHSVTVLANVAQRNSQ